MNTHPSARCLCVAGGQYEAAVRYYTKAIKIAAKESRERGSESEEERSHKAVYFANRALAHLRCEALLRIFLMQANILLAVLCGGQVGQLRERRERLNTRN